MPSLVSEADLARTYDGSPYDDTAEAIEQYRTVQEHLENRPSSSYGEISRETGIPLSRTTSWVKNGRTPIAVKAIETAKSYGWIDVSADDVKFEPLNALVSNVFSGGSILQNWTPTFVTNHAGLDSIVVEALEAAGTGYTIQEAREGNRSTVVRPERDGAILGRVLHVLGAPMGKKSELEELSLPAYLDNAPDRIREQFVLCYIANRGNPDTESAAVRIIETRPKEYRDELAGLIEDVSGDQVTSGERVVTISADSARSLCLEGVGYV